MVDLKPASPPGPATGGTHPPSVDQCTVIDVQPEEYTVDVITEFTNKRLEGIPFAVPYCHPLGPEHSGPMPEPGAEGLLLFPSDNTKPVLLAYTMQMSEEEGASGARPEMNMGDIYHGTRDGNCVAIRRGGVVEVKSTSLAQRLYIPIGGLIRDIFEQWEGKSLLGEFSWKHAPRDPEDPNQLDKTWARWNWKLKEFVEDEDPSIECQAGYVDVELTSGAGSGPSSGSQTYLEMKIIPQGESEKLIWRFDKDGNVYFKTEGFQFYEVTGQIKLNTSDSVTWEGAGGFKLEVGADGSLTLKASRVTMEAVSKMIDKSVSRVLDSKNIKLVSESASQPAVRGLDLVQLFVSHGHTSGGAGPPANAADAIRILSKYVRLE